MLVLFIAIHLLTVVEGFHDYFGLKQRQEGGSGLNWHLIDAASWGVIFAMMGYVEVSGWAWLGKALILGMGCRWAIFSNVHTALRGKNFLYTGDTDLLDQWLREIPPLWSDYRRPSAFALRWAFYVASVVVFAVA